MDIHNFNHYFIFEGNILRIRINRTNGIYESETSITGEHFNTLKAGTAQPLSEFLYHQKFYFVLEYLISKGDPFYIAYQHATNYMDTQSVQKLRKPIAKG